MNNIKNSRTGSFFIITLIYITALFIGITIYTISAKWAWSELWRLFVADMVATVWVWFFGLLFKNVSVYDPYWSVAPPVMLTAIACQIGSWSNATILLLTAVWLWGIRLTGNWAYTFRNLNAEDWRYTKYRNSLHPFLFHLVNLFGLHTMPTIVVFLVMIPGFKLIDLYASANMFTWLAFFVSVGSALLQLIADNQRHRFVKTQKGGVCNIGLWAHGRHPNYLGEITMWWGIFLMFLSVSPDMAHDWHWLIGAVCNTCLFCFISIPLMEKRQLQNKPEYLNYKKRTRLFI